MTFKFNDKDVQKCEIQEGGTPLLYIFIYNPVCVCVYVQENGKTQKHKYNSSFKKRKTFFYLVDGSKGQLQFQVIVKIDPLTIY